MSKVCDYSEKCENYEREYCKTCMHNNSIGDYFKRKTYRDCKSIYCLNNLDRKCTMKDVKVGSQGECLDVSIPY